MKTMTCLEMGGACDKTFSANTFDEMVELSKSHGMEMMMQGDPAHLEVMGKMQALMQSPEDMQAFFDTKRKEFEAHPED